MRYSGMATRAIEIIKGVYERARGVRAVTRGQTAQRFAIAESETRLHAVRTMICDAANKIADGEEARIEISMAKVFVTNITQEAIGLAIQACGGNGIGKDLPLADFYESIRPFRIVDGADEVHKRTIAREAFGTVDTSEVANLTRL